MLEFQTLCGWENVIIRKDEQILFNAPLLRSHHLSLFNLQVLVMRQGPSTSSSARLWMRTSERHSRNGVSMWTEIQLSSWKYHWWPEAPNNHQWLISISASMLILVETSHLYGTRTLTLCIACSLQQRGRAEETTIRVCLMYRRTLDTVDDLASYQAYC